MARGAVSAGGDGLVDVLGVGAVAVDDVLVVGAYPPADEKAEVVERRRACGGLAATALVAAARLGASCAYAGALGRDELSAFALACLEREGVDVRDVVLGEDARPIHSVVVVDRGTGTRNIFFDQSRFAGPAPLAAEVIRRARVVLVDHLGLEGTIAIARVARAAGIPVVADLEGGNDDPRMEELLASIDHLVVSASFAATLTGAADAETAVDALWSGSRTAVVVTCGSRGSWQRDRAGCAFETRAFAVEARDTTGCGDIFHGAYALGLARGLPLLERVRFASAAAALAAESGDGGQAAAPTGAAVAALLARAPDAGR